MNVENVFTVELVQIYGVVSRKALEVGRYPTCLPKGIQSQMMRVNPRELNPYFKDNGSGYPDGGVEKKLVEINFPQLHLLGMEMQAGDCGRKMDSPGQMAVSAASRVAAPSRAHRHAIKKQKERINQGTRCYDRWLPTHCIHPQLLFAYKWLVSLKQAKDMAQIHVAQTHRKEVQTPIHCSHSLFYEVFRTEANLLPTVSPCNVKEIELADGTTSWEAEVGSRKVVHFDEGGLEHFKDEVVAIDRHANKITYRVLEGNLMMHLYDSFVATLEVKPGTAKWTVEFQKKNELCPDPDIYLRRLDHVNKDLDRHLRPTS
ncbi:hypothetical protein SADUNF_Sadunf04G0033300 [Salix dunnii]|uniref:Bet v I/Major latex protein domain-containing protein n=1 Tax=Salix dunnii TaxID=1413687 RepID=A0A835K5S5_9ROSI|nr:hypothetical protein SADUNF_Sadunf04G0033300 [Salix dunnii]